LKARRDSSAPTCAVTVLLSDVRSTSRTKRPMPSLVLSATLPTNPSQTMTSAFPLKMSRPSTLPMKWMGRALSRGSASRVSSLPLDSSSPMESRPTRGLAILKTLRAYISPITANCSRFCALQSTLAPTSRSTQGFPFEVGMGVAKAGRSTPGSAPSTIFAVAIAAPVFPAVTKPAALPSRTSFKPTRNELSRLERTAWAAFSSIPTRSEAWWMMMGRSSSPRYSSSRSRISGSGPIRCTRTGSARQARMAPRISGSGALSEPTASSTMSVSIWIESYLASFTSSTARPLYAPHLGQARWGSFFSWQLGHSERPTAVRKSWARRSAVLRVEWRLFGLGMMQFLSSLRPFPVRPAVNYAGAWAARGLDCLPAWAEQPQFHLGFPGADVSGLDPVAESSQRLPAGVAWTHFAGARPAVAVLTAARAKSFAVGLAQSPDRQGQKHLLAQHILKQQTVLLIITDFGLRRCNRPFRGLGIGR